MLLFPEVGDLAEEVGRLFEELEQTRQKPCRSATGVYTPDLDVIEREASVEVYVDLAGVAPDDVAVLFKAGTLVVAGEKRPLPSGPERQAFLLVERACGRFARAVRISPAVDIQRARAVFRAGELRISLPRIADRRGREYRIPVEKES